MFPTNIRCLVGAAFIAVFALNVGCASLQPADSQPGLNGRERHALTESFYWLPNQPTPTYHPEQLDALLSRSTDPTLDGGRAEMQASVVALALAAVGDELFAAALERQSVEVRQAVAREISHLWTHYRLRYPRTQAML